MQDTLLLYIATHLHYYSFRTEAAKELKRELERWTIDSSKNQTSLLLRFFAFFSDNPVLDHYGLSALVGEPHCGEIIGRTAEAYFGADRRPLTLRRKGTQQGDESALYLDDRALAEHISQTLEETRRICDAYTDNRDKLFQQQTQMFSHILNGSFVEGGKKRHSPTMLGVLVCATFYFLTVQFLSCASSFWWALADIRMRVPALLSAGGTIFLRFLFCCALLIASVLLLPDSINIAVKATYRLRIRVAFWLAKARQQKLTNKIKAMSPEEWLLRLQNAMRTDRNTLSVHPASGVYTLRSSVLMRKPATQVVYVAALPSEPWKRYRSSGEKQTLLFRVILIICVALTTGWL